MFAAVDRTKPKSSQYLSYIVKCLYQNVLVVGKYIRILRYKWIPQQFIDMLEWYYGVECDHGYDNV